MATGGIFTIITNDGKQDRMLMATALLSSRLAAINAANVQRNGGAPDALHNLPTLLDIEKTHVLFTNAHFKPFAAIGFEYQKVNAEAGSPALGGSHKHSLPQFGDFFHDVAAHVVLSQPTLTSTATSDSNAPLMRWCAFPGERLLANVKQTVNGNTLDEYTPISANFHREYRVASNKKQAWARCVGQEESEKGFVAQPNWTASGVTAASVGHRVVSEVQCGAQTPTGQKNTAAAGDLHLFIPLLFWYCQDVRLAVPSVAIPYGQRYIEFQLASLSELCDVVPRGAGTWAAPNGSLSTPTPTVKSFELYLNNIFVNPEVHKIYIKRIGFSLIRVHKEQVIPCTTASGEVQLSNLKWPIEYLFVGMRVADYWSSKTASVSRQHLDKWHKFTKVEKTTYKTTGQNTLKSRVLSVVLSGTAVSGTDGLQVTAAGNLRVVSTAAGHTVTVTASDLAVGDWVMVQGAMYQLATVVALAYPLAVTNATTVLGTVANPPAADTDIVDDSSSLVRQLTPQGLEVEVDKPVSTLDSLGIKAHGITIYQNFPTKFYNAYVSYQYGGPNITTPEDTGACMVPFCLYPGTYQPSGHINVSRAREFYISWDSSVIDNSTNGSLMVCASAINFLLISDGSAVLRYTT